MLLELASMHYACGYYSVALVCIRFDLDGVLLLSNDISANTYKSVY